MKKQVAELSASDIHVLSTCVGRPVLLSRLSREARQSVTALVPGACLLKLQPSTGREQTEQVGIAAHFIQAPDPSSCALVAHSLPDIFAIETLRQKYCL